MLVVGTGQGSSSATYGSCWSVRLLYFAAVPKSRSAQTEEDHRPYERWITRTHARVHIGPYRPTTPNFLCCRFEDCCRTFGIAIAGGQYR